MKVLVSYYSDTGNTEKVAKAIYDSLEQCEKDISLIKDASNLEAYDLIFCGFPVHSMGLPKKAEEFVKGIPEGKKVAYFGTHGSLRGGELAITAFYAALFHVKTSEGHGNIWMPRCRQDEYY